MWLIHIENSFLQSGILLFLGRNINNPQYHKFVRISTGIAILPHVKQLVTTFVILVESTHLMRKWQKLYESVRRLDSIMITWQHSTSGPVSELDSDTSLIHNSQINNLTNMLVLLSDDTWIDFCITFDNARDSSVYRWWPMFQSCTECNVVKRNIQPGRIHPISQYSLTGEWIYAVLLSSISFLIVLFTQCIITWIALNCIMVPVIIHLEIPTMSS